MAAIPTLDQEDAKRPNRERENLMRERTRLVNRMKACLVRWGIHAFNPRLRQASERLEALRTPEGESLPPNTQAEMRRDMARLRIVCEQIKEVERERLLKLEATPPAEVGPQAMVCLIARVIGIGIETADMLVNEILSRHLRDRRAVARYAGLTGAPDESGRRRREKGLARAGNARVRRGMIQLAWRFLRFPERQRAGPMVLGANGRWTRRHAQDHDCGAGTQAAHCALAHGDYGRNPRRRRAARSRVSLQTKTDPSSPAEHSRRLLGHPEAAVTRATTRQCAARKNGPAARSFASDAQCCIMVPDSMSDRIRVCGAILRADRGTLPSGKVLLSSGASASLRRTRKINGIGPPDSPQLTRTQWKSPLDGGYAIQVVADGRQYRVAGVAGAAGEMIAAHAVLALEMANHWRHAARRRKPRLIAAASPRFLPQHRPESASPVAHAGPCRRHR